MYFIDACLLLYSYDYFVAINYNLKDNYQYIVPIKAVAEQFYHYK